jgi:hypothetical protein
MIAYKNGNRKKCNQLNRLKRDEKMALAYDLYKDVHSIVFSREQKYILF